MGSPRAQVPGMSNNLISFYPWVHGSGDNVHRGTSEPKGPRTVPRYAAPQKQRTCASWCTRCQLTNVSRRTGRQKEPQHLPYSVMKVHPTKDLCNSPGITHSSIKAGPPQGLSYVQRTFYNHNNGACLPTNEM